jgi:hypothetical protein
MNTTHTEYKSEPVTEFDTKKHCSICKCNGAVRKHTYYFLQNRKAKVCIHCALKFDSTAKVVDWLTKNAIFSKSGKLINFKYSDLIQKEKTWDKDSKDVLEK